MAEYLLPYEDVNPEDDSQEEQIKQQQQEEEQEDEKQEHCVGDAQVSNFDAYLDDPPACDLWPQARVECLRCGRKGRFYCPDCVEFVGKPDGVEVPRALRLPLQVDVIVTSEERRRSSGIHIAVVAPQSVRVVAFEQGEGGLPVYRPESDVVVFPSEDSVCWEDMSEEELAAVRRIVLIDSRWVNAGSVVGHPKVRGLRHVRIRAPPARSRFWRWHSAGDGHICTAEAIYFILKEFEQASGVSTEGGRLEDVLFLFALMHSRIKDAYNEDPSKAGLEDPASEASKRARRVRSVRLDRLVKAKYRGLDDVKERHGIDAAVDEFWLRRRGEGSIYQESAVLQHTKSTSATASSPQGVRGETDGVIVAGLTGDDGVLDTRLS